MGQDCITVENVTRVEVQVKSKKETTYFAIIIVLFWVLLIGTIACSIYLNSKQKKLKSLTEDLEHIEKSYKNGHEGFDRKSIELSELERKT
jgi:hypothetical protein